MEWIHMTREQRLNEVGTMPCGMNWLKGESLDRHPYHARSTQTRTSFGTGNGGVPPAP
jgi:hypothetical protein